MHRTSVSTLSPATHHRGHPATTHLLTYDSQDDALAFVRRQSLVSSEQCDAAGRNCRVPVPANCAMRGRSSGATSISKYSRRYVSDARKLFACSIGVYVNCMIHTLLQPKALVPHSKPRNGDRRPPRISNANVKNTHHSLVCDLTCAPYLRASSLKANSDC